MPIVDHTDAQRVPYKTIHDSAARDGQRKCLALIPAHWHKRAKPLQRYMGCKCIPGAPGALHASPSFRLLPLALTPRAEAGKVVPAWQ